MPLLPGPPRILWISQRSSILVPICHLCFSPGQVSVWAELPNGDTSPIDAAQEMHWLDGESGGNSTPHEEHIRFSGMVSIEGYECDPTISAWKRKPDSGNHAPIKHS